MLDIQNLTKVFSKGTAYEHIAIDKLNLHVDSGDFICLLGSNGAGKSSLFNAISGFFWVDSGKILLENKNITFEDEHKRASYIGRLFQDPMSGTAPSMTIEENLALSFSRSKRRGLHFAVKKNDREFFKTSLSEFNMDLENRLQTKVGLLSGGQRQALTLLMATIVPPKLLLLDEHTAALDPTTAQKVMEITKKIIEKHKLTTLMITHNMQSALDYGNRTLMLNKGKIVLDIKGEKRANMTINDLIDSYSKTQNNEVLSDRILLS